jgi:hypothetical protein
MPVPKGTRIGGRTKGTLNKRTLEKLNEVLQQVGEIKLSVRAVLPWRTFMRPCRGGNELARCR